MKTLLIFLFSLWFVNAYAQTGFQITYVVNEGFIIKSGNKKIMIDVTLSESKHKELGVNDKIIESLIESNEPFDNIDILFVTHSHEDHFDPEMTVMFLLKSKITLLVCPVQAVSMMESINGFQLVKSRIYPIDNSPSVKINLNIQDIKIIAMSLLHVPYMVKDEKTGKQANRFKDIQNVGYLINLNGVKIFHAGDNILLPREEYELYSLYKESIHVAFLEALFWPDYLFEEKRAVIQELIKPDRIVLMHLKLGEDLSSVSKKRKDAYPSLIYFSKPLEKIRLDFD